MSLKSLISNIFNKLWGKMAVLNPVLNHGEHRGDTTANSNLTPDTAPTVTRSRHRHHPKVNFNLSEALRLLADGWSYRKIARKMGISYETVRTRLREYEAQVEAAKPKPEPVRPVPLSPIMPVTPPESAPEPAQAPIPIPEPISNYDDLIAFERWRGAPDFKPNTRRFWLVNGARNLEFCTHAEQLAVAVDVWHRDYDRMSEFQNADRIWVILDPREDNRAFLLSIAADIWIRERVLVVRSSALDICRRRLMWDRDRKVRLTASREVLDYEDAEFAKAHNLIPIPVPNAVRDLDKLLEKPPEPEKPSLIGGSFCGSYGPQQPQLQIEDRGDERCGFAF